MTKDFEYPEEVKEKYWLHITNEVGKDKKDWDKKDPIFKKFMKEEDYKKLMEQMADNERYCDCYSRCPRCGKKYKPITDWNTYLKQCERT